ncbi:hypothetical protein KY289_030394 [Solanum tuberosum]|nr:hypothetical protein KY289_030394 [Solanum tuberosum]
MASFYISFDVNISRDLHEPALVIGGCFVLVALILSLLLIFQHLRYYTSLVVSSQFRGERQVVELLEDESRKQISQSLQCQHFNTYILMFGAKEITLLFLCLFSKSRLIRSHSYQ